MTALTAEAGIVIILFGSWRGRKKKKKISRLIFFPPASRTDSFRYFQAVRLRLESCGLPED